MVILDEIRVEMTGYRKEMTELADVLNIKAAKERGFKNIIETLAGATITSHCGPKTLGILYFNDGGVRE